MNVRFAVSEIQTRLPASGPKPDVTAAPHLARLNGGANLTLLLKLTLT